MSSYVIIWSDSILFHFISCYVKSCYIIVCYVKIRILYDHVVESKNVSWYTHIHIYIYKPLLYEVSVRRAALRCAFHGVRQWEGWHPIYEMEHKIHVWNHQPGINMIKYAPIRPIHIISEVFLRSWWVNSHFPTSNSAARYSPEPARRLAQQDSAATARAQLGFDLDLGLQVSR